MCIKNIFMGAILGSLLFSCQSKDSPPTEVVNLPEPIVKEVAPPVEEATPKAEAQVALETKVHIEPNIERGRTVYYSNCLQCHNKDPNVKGSLGPDQADTPYEVFEAKVLTGRYPEKLPPGYTPKRKTKAMRAFPKLKDDIPHLYAWIQSMKK